MRFFGTCAIDKKAKIATVNEHFPNEHNDGKAFF
jgi:hypothetical protein